MKRYFIRLSFDGTAYHGWQIQQNASSVQAEVEAAISALLRQKTSVTGCGRTDAGVHAKQFFAHFDAEDIQKSMTHRLNAMLPPDIAVQKIFEVPKHAHARFSAVSRTYRYHMALKKDPFNIRMVMPCYQTLDTDEMNRACSILKNHTDFSSFCKSNEQAYDNLCIISAAEWINGGDVLYLEITANRFLRNMVRAVAGTMLLIGQGKMDLNHFQHIIEAKNRKEAGPSLPACGLCLTHVAYPDDLLKKGTHV